MCESTGHAQLHYECGKCEPATIASYRDNWERLFSCCADEDVLIARSANTVFSGIGLSNRPDLEGGVSDGSVHSWAHCTILKPSWSLLDPFSCN